MLRHATATVNGVRLHYVSVGRGEPLVLLHGWPTTWREWLPVMPSLAQKHTLIVPDLRGMGDSDKPVSGYDAQNVAKDISDLMRSLGHARYSVAGHDIDANPAYALARAHPDRVRRLAIIEGMPSGIAPPAQPTTQSGEAPPSYWHLNFQAQRDIPEALIQGRERLYINHFFKTYAFNPAAVSEAEIDEYARAYAQPGALRGGFEHYRVMASDAKLNRAMTTKLSMPVLALGGQSVMGDGVLLGMQTVATNVRGGAIADCGHWVMSEQPGELSRQMLAFFGE
jgi:pimeloyl-ACP methyl ester carboxylesterase